MDRGLLEPAGQQAAATECFHLRAREPAYLELARWIGVWLTDHLGVYNQTCCAVNGILEQPDRSLRAEA
jgi:hypothetical protein